MKGTWRVTVVVGLLVLSTLAVAGSAAGAGKVGPKQYFTGVINGHDGNTVTPIQITVACSSPANTGHPVGGQTLAVHQEFPPQAAGGLGYTGNDSKIGVFFNAPPPSGRSAAKAGKTVTFTRYDKTKALPTSITVPCSGTGNVYFVPIPVVPPSQSQSVPVEFVGE
ncbi:MAG TPA: hypothetical protein VMF60_00480 [Acidimicrobiales bacterium]|nr:hypothetical protein [Acidimicrobiales bacterium]